MISSLPNKILLLGYPIDRVPYEALEDVLLQLIESYIGDGQVRYATSITGLVLGKLSGFVLYKRSMPQVVNTLRQADFIGINSKELQLLAKLLGNNIDSLILPEDLLFASASLLSKHKQSMFLLGGNENLCNRTATALSLDFPGLKIAGVAAPGIYTKGLELNESIETDDVLIEMINEAAPSVLALHLGHPKQEIWLERIRDKIKVPLIIGVGGSFEPYLAKRENRKQEIFSSLTWDKIKQKVMSVLHYCCWIPPLLVYHNINRLLYSAFYKYFKSPIGKSRLFLSQKESLFVATFPHFVNRNTWDRQLQSLGEAFEHENIVLDFGNVKHINPSGMGLLHAIWKQMRYTNKNLFLIGVSGDIEILLKLNGAWDMISASVVRGPDDVLGRLSINRNENLLRNRVFLSFDHIENQTQLSFFGRINSYDVEKESGFQLEPIVSGKGLAVDLTHCTSISNLGFGFLLRLRELQKRQKQALVIQNANAFVMHQFKYYHLDNFFKFI